MKKMFSKFTTFEKIKNSFPRISRVFHHFDVANVVGHNELCYKKQNDDSFPSLGYGESLKKCCV
jgi:hypothetical protein